jgi:hypothetical protein
VRARIGLTGQGPASVLLRTFQEDQTGDGDRIDAKHAPVRNEHFLQRDRSG